MLLRRRLQIELAERIRRNPRYSIRAFARWIGRDPSTVSRALAGRIGLSRPMIARIARLLRLDPEETQQAYAWEDADRIVRLIDRPDFRPDVRWIAVTSGVGLDDVQRALHLLLYERRISMQAAGWRRLPDPHTP
jgi:plasmid maintenance system antidote protein VapI